MDVGYSCSAFLKGLRVRLLSEEDRRTGRAPPATENPRDVMAKFLRNMLKSMLKRIEDAPEDLSIGHPLLRKKGVLNSVKDLSAQIMRFWDDEYPFWVQDRASIKDPLLWWQDITKSDSADVLGVGFLTLSLVLNYSYLISHHWRSF